MTKLILIPALSASIFDCSFSNSEKQKQWPGKDQSAQNQRSTNTETGPNSPSGTSGQNQTQKSSDDYKSTSNPKGVPGDMTQQNNKDARTQGTTAGPSPNKQ